MSARVVRQSQDAVEELYRMPENGKAEIIDGRVMRFMPTGKRPGRVSSLIFMSLFQHERQHGSGVAINDNAGFLVNLPNRESFSPDAAWYGGNTGDEANEMDFYEGAPVFAVEVRSKEDYGKYAESQMAAMGGDYFAAGALVVWDVDIRSEAVVRAYQRDNPAQPVIFRRGEIADTEPAVPGWRMAVDELFQ